MQYLQTSDYEKTMQALFKRVFAPRVDLRIMESLLEKVGDPQHAFPSIHVAGTNGKGSVCRKLAVALQSAGYRVGLYLSPHIHTFEERISINDQMIPKEKVIEYYSKIDDPKPNFFECATSFCFQYFKEKQVDIAIIETGLGGALDATNVITPLLSIITSISLDHTEILGETLEKIAEQKGGIIKPKIPVILGPRVQFASIYERAKTLLAPVSQVQTRFSLYEEENRAIAQSALTVLSSYFKLKPCDVIAGLEAQLPCRLQQLGNMILDVAHNPDGFARLSQALDHLFPNQMFRFVVGMSCRKDVRGCLEAIEQKIKHIHFVTSGHEGAATLDELVQAFRTISTKPYSLENGVRSGVERAKAAAKEKIVVCGSLYIMDEILRHAERK